MERHVFVLDVADACLDGHFPDRPIIPGVVLIEAALSAFGWAPPLCIEQAKFLHPCAPGMALELSAAKTSVGIDLRIEHAGALMASARVRASAVTNKVRDHV